MRLDVIIPTFNRADMLGGALNSLLRAPVPPDLSVTITVVDNNSTDHTRAVVASLASRSNGRIQYAVETRQGRSHALNRGIAITEGDLVGTVDDDEEIDASWYATIARAFMSPELDFIGGPYVPDWSAPPPAWLPPQYGAVVGWVDGGDKPLPYDHSYPGVLMGGNAVFRRSVLRAVGPYAVWLGRTEAGLLSGEDRDMYQRLLAANARGRYLPDLIIYHHIPAQRLSKKYFRSWCFWHAVSLGLIERRGHEPGARLLGIPRWRFRQAARGLVAAISATMVKPHDPAGAFATELAMWECAGLLYGRHVFRRGIAHDASGSTE